MQDPESAARASLFRSLLIYTALFAADIAVVFWVVSASKGPGAFVTLSIVGVVGLLLGYQSWQHFRDMRASLAESTGIVQRKWSRADLIIAWHSYYLTVDRTVFRVQPEDFIKVDEAMYVKVVHFPNTLNVVSIHEFPRPAPDSAPPI